MESNLVKYQGGINFDWWIKIKEMDNLPDLIIIKIGEYLKGFYDFLSLSLVSRRFMKNLDIRSRIIEMPIPPITRDEIFTLTDFMIYQYHNRPDWLDSLQASSLTKWPSVMKRDNSSEENRAEYNNLISNEWDYSPVKYLSKPPWYHFVKKLYCWYMPFRTKYLICREWKKFQMKRKGWFIRLSASDQNIFIHRLEDSYTMAKFLKEKKNSYGAADVFEFNKEKDLNL